MKVKPRKQPNSIACGPTCIFAIEKYFNGKHSLKEIEKITNYKREGGVSDIGIVNALKYLGYVVERKLGCSWEDLTKHNTTDTVCIVSWMKEGYKGHVSILDRVTKDHVFLMDPDVGKVIRIAKIPFMRLWMEYDAHWWPRTSKDIHLRPLIITRQKS